MDYCVLSHIWWLFRKLWPELFPRPLRQFLCWFEAKTMSAEVGLYTSLIKITKSLTIALKNSIFNKIKINGNVCSSFVELVRRIYEMLQGYPHSQGQNDPSILLVALKQQRQFVVYCSYLVYNDSESISEEPLYMEWLTVMRESMSP